MRAIIIGDGLAEANLSPDDFSHPAHVGPHEIKRLMASGKDYGHGPLPTFLRLATGDAAPQHLEVLVLDAALDVRPMKLAHDTFSTRSGLAGALRDIRRKAGVIPLPTHSIPWKFIEDKVDAAGHAATAEAGPEAEVRCLVVGTHTERRILAIALFLRTLLSNPRVAVAAHLVGSAIREAHFSTLRSTLPASGVEVLLDLEEAAEFVGLDPQPLSGFSHRRCQIEPEDLRQSLDPTQLQIVEHLCMHWTQADLRPLQGGFSGSALFLAEGSQGASRTEPLVLKIDRGTLMSRELNGYYQVRDLLGRNVPNIGHPVRLDGWIGVGMELAAMEGRPLTLQDVYEEAESEEEIRLFLRRFDKALGLLTDKLYRNTRSLAWVLPYRAFQLHTEQVLKWFRENTEVILGYCREQGIELDIATDELASGLHAIGTNENGLDTEVCLRHGDLNFANILCDEGENLWFIDWTHSGWGPLEHDFAKLENDVKIVMSKDLQVDDVDKLRQLERFLISRPQLPEAHDLPPELGFIRWDLRFRKILNTVRRIREVCFSLKESPEWLVYRVGLLRFALHTLSFDRRRGQGECDLPQLVHGLFSVQVLVDQLSQDRFNLQTGGERPPSYPPRQRILMSQAAWDVECPGYDPPYYVDPEVLANDFTVRSNGWADPEEAPPAAEMEKLPPGTPVDDAGRLLNPSGRTGIVGRGLLGCWGRNLSVSAVVIRIGTGPGQAEILLGRREVGRELDLPKGFVLPGETPDDALKRVLEEETGWSPGDRGPSILQDGYVFDPRQTDHAWVESRAVLFALPWARTGLGLKPGRDFVEVRWRPLTARSVNRVNSDQAKWIRAAVIELKEDGTMHPDQADLLLDHTG